MRDKNQVAKTPPMGWNSWDCYGASVTEEELRKNAEYMATHLKQFGWEYIVCDIQWYEPTADSTEYHKFVPLEMDEYARLVPAVNRFPSAANGKGFGPIAEYVHSLGLKFGIHMMRGIPRQAALYNTPIKGTTTTAREIAHPFSICSWNTDMYGVMAGVYGAQEYYDSLFELYAEWGVDYVKVDDICVTEYKPHDLYSAKEEIEMIRIAIDRCNRPIVLSLSPGPAILEQAEHLAQNANMWRITGDFWDNWRALYAMFERCKKWAPYVKEGCWPDCDMLPVGHIAIRNGDPTFANRTTFFSKEEQRTMLTLWCMFRSPLMIGCELRDLDDWTLSLLTNPDVLKLLSDSKDAHEVMNANGIIVWESTLLDGRKNIAVFNTHYATMSVEIPLERFAIDTSCELKDLWNQNIIKVSKQLRLEIKAHDAVLLQMQP